MMTARYDLDSALPKKWGAAGEDGTSCDATRIPADLDENEVPEDPSVRWNPIALRIAMSDSGDLD